MNGGFKAMKDLTEAETDAAMGVSLKEASQYGGAVDLGTPDGIGVAIKNAIAHAYAVGWRSGMHYGRQIGDPSRRTADL